MLENTAVEDHSSLDRYDKRMGKIMTALEVWDWISVALAGMAGLILVLYKGIETVELVLTKPVLIQLSLFLPYVSLIAFLTRFLKIQKKHGGELIVKLLAYGGLVWVMANVLPIVWHAVMG